MPTGRKTSTHSINSSLSSHSPPYPLLLLLLLLLSQVVHNCIVIQDRGVLHCVCAVCQIKNPSHLSQKSRALRPGGGFHPTIISSSPSSDIIIHWITGSRLPEPTPGGASMASVHTAIWRYRMEPVSRCDL